IKWATLIKWSTTTQIESYPDLVLGSPVIKSIPTLSHFQSSTGNGCSNPAGFWCSAFTRLHTSHRATCLAISPFMLFHQNLLFKSIYIFVLPDVWNTASYGPPAKSTPLSPGRWAQTNGLHTTRYHARPREYPFSRFSFIF